MKQLTYSIRKMAPADWTQVRNIYKEGLSTGVSSFITQLPSWKKWNAEHLQLGRLVATADDKKIFGWCALHTVPDT